MSNKNQPGRSKIDGPTATLTWVGVLAGACIILGHSFAGQATDDATLAATGMTGANLSELHAAIPASTEQESAPSI
jgi:hypothetical protein